MSSAPGRVWLVGAGPWASDLVTVRGRELIERADVVVHDRLVSPDLLALASEKAELISVGKTPGGSGVSQDRTNEMLVEQARLGRRVVRLKGGDPLVFGRGGEEAGYLRAHGVEYEIVPGVSAAVAAGAMAGIPLTHRGVAPAVAFVTGNEDPEKDGGDVDYAALARFPGTLCFYMGVGRAGQIARTLIGHGKSGRTPCAVIAGATTAGERIVTGRLERIADAIADNGIAPPALLIIGEVVELAGQISWRDRLPLFGKKVVVTRSRRQASGLSARLRELGAGVIEFPTIRIVPRRMDVEIGSALENIANYDWIVFTSPNGVECFFRRLDESGWDVRSLAGIKIAAIGSGTKAALRRSGVLADLVPERYVAEGLLAAFSAFPVRGKQILLARASQARDVLPRGFSEMGAVVAELALYDTVQPGGIDVEGFLQNAGDYVTFASSTTAGNFFELLGAAAAREFLSRTRVVSIGPVTTATLVGLGATVAHEAEVSTIDGVVAGICRDVANQLRNG